MFKTKIVSSLEKAFVDGSIDEFDVFRCTKALRGERISFQLLHTRDNEIVERTVFKLKLRGSLAEYAEAFDVEGVPVTRACYPDLMDDNYLKTSPGIYPDVLRPLYMEGSVIILPEVLGAVWIEIDVPENFPIGEHSLKLTLDGGELGIIENEFKIEILNATLPKDVIKNTEWFHCDSLANYYDVEVWSEEHWRIVEAFLRTARKNGMNMVLTPVFTPPLDTKIGGERRTNQLVGVTRECGKYSFDFALLDRWIETCDRVGIKYFEISHFFTQWGALHAPKVMATADGECRRIFGWDTDAVSAEYGEFLRAFLSAFLKHMKKRGDDKRCYFHISDEPKVNNIENYEKAKAQVKELLRPYTVMDAMSNYDFLKKGLVDVAIPGTNHIGPFLENKVEGLWTYYCCAQAVDVSNRFIAMPSWRNRSIGMQFFKYNIVGFLQWGYNFYQTSYSTDVLNPFTDLSSGGMFPAGDAFSVYPARDGTALESLRLVVFNEALQDLAAMKLLEGFMPHDEIVREIENAFGKTVEFNVCATSAAQLLAVREKINELIKKHTA